MVDQPSPLLLLWFLRHLVVCFAWKILSSYVYYLRNIDAKLRHLVVCFAWKILSSYVHYLRNIEAELSLRIFFSQGFETRVPRTTNVE